MLLDADGPRELTFACKVETLDRPGRRWPSGCRRRSSTTTSPGEPIHAFLRDFDAAWDAAAPLSAFGPRQRWTAACEALANTWPVDVSRARHGEISVPWSAVSP